MMAFIKEYNERTADSRGYVMPAVITIFEDRSFSFVTKTPPAADLIKQGRRRREGQRPSRTETRSARVTARQVREIAEIKMNDLNANDIEPAMRMIEGTARSMGVEVAIDDAQARKEVPRRGRAARRRAPLRDR